jgi:hypothetical protein
MSTTIILTSTVNINSKKYFLHQVNKNERLQSYLKSVLQWLKKTDLKIILVENSGYKYEELHQYLSDRFEIISFKEDELQDVDGKNVFNCTSKGISELYAINYAFNHSKIIEHDELTFIIKITARFFIPNFDNFLATYNLTYYDCLTQNESSRCEIVGSRYDNFKSMFNIYNEQSCFTHHVEALYESRARSFKNVLRCDLFQIESTPRGGAPMSFTDL